MSQLHHEQTELEVFKRAVLDQDQDSWTLLWQRYHRTVYSAVQRKLMGWKLQSDELREITQEVFLKFWQDTSKWGEITCLYTRGEREGILSRLHSTTIFTVQRYRQYRIRKWIPCIRKNINRLNQENRKCLKDLACREMAPKYSAIFLMHLENISNNDISKQINQPGRVVSITINRAWERFMYILLQHRNTDRSFDELFQYLINPDSGGS